MWTRCRVRQHIASSVSLTLLKSGFEAQFPSMISCQTLGPVGLSVDGAPAPSELLWRKHLGLLVYLARSPRGRAREHLIGLLWGEKPEAAARHSLNEAIRVLRRYLGEGNVDTSVGQVRLAEGSVKLDIDRLEEYAAAGEWEAASRLITGEFLEGFSISGASDFENWLASERSAIRSRCIEVLARHAEDLLRAGQAQEASAVAAAALSLDPGSELALRIMMRSLVLAGDRAGALERYEGSPRDCSRRSGHSPIRRRRHWQSGCDTSAPSGHPRPVAPESLQRESLVCLWSGANPSCPPRRCCSRRAGRATCVRLDPRRGKRSGEDPADGGAAREAAARWRRRSRSSCGRRGSRRRVERHSRTRPGRSARGSGIGRRTRPGSGRIRRRPFGVGRPIPPSPQRWRAPFLGSGLERNPRAASEEQPIALAIDDAQWLDNASMQALRAVLRDLESAPLILLFATDSHPPPGRAGCPPQPAGECREWRCRPVGLPRILRPAHPCPANAARVQRCRDRAGSPPGGHRLRRPPPPGGRAAPGRGPGAGSSGDRGAWPAIQDAGPDHAGGSPRHCARRYPRGVSPAESRCATGLGGRIGPGRSSLARSAGSSVGPSGKQGGGGPR